MTTDAAQSLVRTLAARGIRDERVLEAIASVDRSAFVPEAMRRSAWEDTALPIGQGQTISQPFIVAAMTEALEPDPRARVLEIGTGSGYQAAVLAHLFRRVYTVERHEALLRRARGLFEEEQYFNITTRVGDGTRGWPEAAPFDAILVTAAAEKNEPPQPLLDQLADGGRLVIPVTRGRSSPLGAPLYGDEQVVDRFRREGNDLHREALWPVRFVPLIGAEG